MSTTIKSSTFVAVDRLPVELRYGHAGRTVVAGEQQDRIIEQSECFEFVVDASDIVVNPRHHLLKDALPVIGIGARSSRREHKRGVRQHHRVIRKERLFLVRLDEPFQEVHEQARSIVAPTRVDRTAVTSFQDWLPVFRSEQDLWERPFGHRCVPQQVAVKAAARDRSLPFA